MNKLFLAFTLTCAAQSAEPAAHARTEFRFTLDIPYDRAAPLFGALAEQKWSPGWKPRFIYPDPPEDRQGAVFFVDSGDHSALWTMTEFDLVRGRIQYVFLLNQAILTRIDIALSRNSASKTDVVVAYHRTALNAAANDHIKHFSSIDASKGAEWKSAIEASMK